MAKNRSVRLEKQQIEAIEKMEEVGLADNKSEAHRNALTAGLTQFGMLNGGSCDTRLRQTARQFGFGFAMIGAFVVGLAYFGGLNSRVLAITPFIMSLACYGLDKALAAYEPHVSTRLSEIMGIKQA